jgi:PAS domain S-box-containing protein
MRPEDAPPAELEPVRILLVDDHPENLLALEGLLARPDYQIISARSGTEALKRVLQHDFAVILLDVMMPTMDGIETARIIRQREASRSTPILFLTATAGDMALVQQGYSVGAVDYLIKPLDPEIVRAKVAVFVDLHRKTQLILWQEEQLREAERRRSEEQKRASEAEYEATFDQAAAGIAHASLDGHWLRVNSALCRLTGYTRDEMLMRSIEDLIHPEDLPEHRAALCWLEREPNRAYRAERRLRNSRGQVLWVQLTVSLLCGPDGRPQKLIVLCEDVTEVKRAEVSQRFLARASETLLASLDYETTLANVVRLAVPALADWCVGYVKDPDGPLRVLEVVHEEPRAREQAKAALLASPCDPEQQVLLHEVLRTQRSRLIFSLSETLAQLGPGKSAHLGVLQQLGATSIMVLPLALRGHVFGEIVLGSTATRGQFSPADLRIAEDLAHRVGLAIDNARLYREAQNAISARDEFLSIASHELRTPLTPLQLQLQRILAPRPSGDMSSERLRDIVKQCERQVQRLCALIDNLLDVSRIRSGRLKLYFEPLEFVAAVKEVLTRLAALGRGEIAFHADAPVPGRWDRLRIEQIVTNLVSNAIKYGGDAPIEVRVQPCDECVKLQVLDHGIGISRDKLTRIFDRFERAVSARSYGGLGLGLYITRQIVEAHGGRIEVESELGHGSVFTVTLPLRADADGAQVESSQEVPSGLGA